MADLDFFQNLNGQGVAQLKGMRIHNITDLAAQQAFEADGNFGAALGADNKGLTIYREDLEALGLWNGTEFIFASAGQLQPIAGDIIFKGMLDASSPIDDVGQPQPIEPIAGYQYAVSVAGTFDAGATGVTLVGDQVLEVGDQVLFTSPTDAYAIQRNDDEATEIELGNVRLATQQKVLDGVQATEAVTSATLQGKLVSQSYVRQYSVVVNIPSMTPLTITHNLNLIDRNSFTINLMRANSAISVDVDSIDENSLSVTSLVAISNVRVTVQGASAT